MKFNISNFRLFILDFDGVLTDNKVLVDQNGGELVLCSRADGLAFDCLKKLKIRTIILSSETNSVVKARGSKLGVEVFQGISDKRKFVHDLLKDFRVTSSQTIFVGNDINDLQSMGLCEISFCPMDAHPLVKSKATVTLSTRGGDGVLREILEDHFNINLYKILYGG